MLSAFYAQLARLRRARFRQPGRRRRLRRPVISVGNLSVGGRGKTPVVAHLVEVLRGLGERPAILTRGYKRRVPADGVVVVHDGDALRADLARAGDEPLMLARRLGHTPVLVSADRYLAGRLAETHFAATLHLLDDGFQHLSLHRDVDLLIVSGEDLDNPRTLPAGRLRESLTAAAEADALLIDSAGTADAAVVGDRLGVGESFTLTRHIHAPRRLDVFRESSPLEPGVRVLAVCGIAEPQRFFDDARALGLEVVGALAYPDHHAYDARDIARIVEQARHRQATVLLTTEKDLVRLLPYRPLPLALAWVPLSVSLDPASRLREWLTGRLAAARSGAA